jgi:hypothetical protein
MPLSISRQNARASWFSVSAISIIAFLDIATSEVVKKKIAVEERK